MNTDDLNAMRFDRRLRNRRDWVSDAQFEAYVESLPDVASKASDVDISRPGPAAAASPSPSASPAAAVAAPLESPGVPAFGALPDEPGSGS